MVLAGGIDETFAARFMASIAAFNAGMASSRPSGCWDPVFMVEIRGGRERIVQREGCEDKYEP